VTAPSDRLAAALASRYRIERELGQGGMATVFLAEDLKHKRRVAVKVLKPELAAVLGAERFVQEITTTAALQHPHILPLFDSGEADGFLYYVMPFIDGETLRSRLDRERQLGVDEAVRITTDVASALHYAHTHGVIHRDIKPENILLHDGRPMVADFGIAIAVSAAAGGRMTETGLSLGTPHYMSPEQATAEKEITARSDVYSLGSVLYEMLAGQPPHLGGSAQQIIMKIITEQPAQVTALRKSVPPHVAAAVAQALEKLPADRFDSADAFAKALANRAFTTASRAAIGGGAPTWQQRAAVPLAGTTALLLALAIWGWARAGADRSGAGGDPLWLAIDPPHGVFGDYPGPVLSPDGTRLAFYAPGADGTIQLWVRDLGSPIAQPVPGSTSTEADLSQQPFWSADGQSLAFFTARALFRTDLDGRAPLKLADAPNPRGGTWGADGVIVFVPATSGLHRLNVADGTVMPVGDTARARGTIDRWPHFLPDGEHFLFLRRAPGAAPTVYVGSLRAPDVRPVLEVSSRAEYADGRLYFVRDAALFSQPFDLDALSLRGTATRVADGVGAGGADARNVAFSAAAGHVVTWSGIGARLSRLVVVGADGRAQRSVGPVGAYAGFTLERGGSRIAVERADLRTAVPGIWIIDLASGQSSVFATPAEGGGTPRWVPGGRDLIYSTFTSSSLVRQSLSSADAVTIPTPTLYWIADITPDGTHAVVQSTRAGTGLDILVLPLAGDSTPRPYLATTSNETGAVLSPDGRWLAYTSDASGRPEVYVQAFPVPGNRHVVSDGAATHAQWSADGRILYYLGGNNDLVAASVTRNGPALSFTRRTLFRFTGIKGTDGVRKPFAPLGDGRFLINVIADTVVPQTMRIGLNWAGR
jgi:Tol biopolymer transport system component/tRNA A-37 threonylcarbamoyl transferase component Bud32